MQRPINFLTLTLTLSLLGACGGEKNDSDTDASDTDATGATDTGVTTTGMTTSGATEQTIGMSSAPTTSTDTTAPTTVTGPDSASASATDDGTAGGMTDVTGASETGGPVETTGAPADLMMLCQDLCDKFVACTMMQPPDCTDECVGEFDGLEDVCELATVGFFECVNSMTCAEFNDFSNNDDPGPCAAEVSAQGDACSDELCTASVGSNEQGTECSYTVDCTDNPDQEMSCVGDTCSCLTGGMEVGTCAAEGVCMDLGLVTEKAQDCCGF